MPYDWPIRALAVHYDLGRWEHVRPLPGGKNQHFHLTTDRSQQWVVRRSYRSKTLAGVAFEHELLRHLRAAGYPTAEPVSTVRGDAAVELEGRVHSVTAFVEGTSYQTGNMAQLEVAAKALATYHDLVESFAPQAPVPRGTPIHEDLRSRLGRLPSRETLWQRLRGQRFEPEAFALAESLGYALEEGRRTLADLDRLYPQLPVTVIHGGCRRGSALFQGDHLAAMIDFDSAREEARVLDLAVAVHDFAKIYGEPGSADYKVHLDRQVAFHFLAAYRSVRSLSTAELEALPLLLRAKRLKRALGRYRRLGEGEPLSTADLRKIALELDRVRSLEANRDELEPALRGA